MPKSKKDDNYISLWRWLFIFFIQCLPLINIIMFVVWCFVGKNETRKNYFRAMIVWFLFWATLIIIVDLFIGWPLIKQLIVKMLQDTQPSPARK